MKIHELNNFQGTPGDGDYLAVDNGTDTARLNIRVLLEAAAGKEMHYGTCSTAAGTAAKVVTCEGFTLETGSTIAVKMTNGNTVTTDCTLNVNGTGAKTISGLYYNDYQSSTNIQNAWTAEAVVIFVYGGANWRIVNEELITGPELRALATTAGTTTTNRLASAIAGIYNKLNNLITNLTTSQQMTVSLTATTGTLQEVHAYRVGGMLNLRVVFSNSGTFAPGDNLFVANINTAGIIPKCGAATGSNYYGRNTLTGAITTSNTIVIRNTGSANIVDPNGANVTWTYAI